MSGTLPKKNEKQKDLCTQYILNVMWFLSVFS